MQPSPAASKTSLKALMIRIASSRTNWGGIPEVHDELYASHEHQQRAAKQPVVR
jgi:hypothetical protein